MTPTRRLVARGRRAVSTHSELLEKRKMIMERRNLLGLLLAALVGIATSATAGTAADDKTAAKCDKSCSECMAQCIKCVKHCASQLADGKKDYAACLTAAADCIEPCVKAGRCCDHPKAAKTAKACAACAKMCRMMTGHKDGE